MVGVDSGLGSCDVVVYVHVNGLRTLRTSRPRRVMLKDDGVRRLAAAVLQQAMADLQSPIPEYRRSAAAFIERRADFDRFWCAPAALEPDAVRERLSEQVPRHEAAASAPVVRQAACQLVRGTSVKTDHNPVGTLLVLGRSEWDRSGSRKAA